MKLNSLISAVVLGLAVHVQAQNIPGAVPAASGVKPVAGDDLNSAIRIETLILKAGPLAEVVAQVERHFIVEDPRKPDVLMPNILYGGDAYNAEVPGDRRLRGVSPLQAVADGGAVVEQVLPDSPASFSPAIKPGRRILSVAEEGKPGVNVAGLELEKVVQLIRGAPGTVVKITLGADTNLGLGEHVFSLVRARLPILPPSEMPPGTPQVKVFNSISPRPALSAAQFGNSSTVPADDNLTSVVVYALGSILSGGGKESDRKERRCEELIRMTLSQAELNSPKSPAGPQTRESYRKLGEYFASQGIAALIYDKRGVGKSGGAYESREPYENLVV